jgi:6-phosphofructokinase
MGQKTVVVLNSGGDSPSLNSTNVGVVYEARKFDWRVLGVRDGYRGLIGNTDKINDLNGVDIVDLTHVDLSQIEYTGGTILGSSRTNPDTPDRKKKITYVMKRYGIDYIIGVGGEDTNAGALALYEAGVELNTVNKTIDNDITHTDFCLGYPSAAHRATTFGGGLLCTLRSHKKYAVIDSFGRDVGWPALASTSYFDLKDLGKYPHKVFPPEVGCISIEDILSVFDEVKREHGYGQLVIGEGLKLMELEHKKNELEKKHGQKVHDEFGHLDYGILGVANFVAEKIRDYLGLKGIKDRESHVKYLKMTYTLRGRPPTNIDRKLAKVAGAHAVDLLAEGTTGKMINITKGNLVAGYDVGDVPLEDVSGGRILEEGMFDRKNWGPTQKFIDYVKQFVPNPREYRLFDEELPKAQLFN